MEVGEGGEVLSFGPENPKSVALSGCNECVCVCGGETHIAICLQLDIICISGAPQSVDTQPTGTRMAENKLPEPDYRKWHLGARLSFFVFGQFVLFHTSPTHYSKCCLNTILKTI